MIKYPPPFEISHNKDDKPSSYSVSQPFSASVNALHYKPAPDHLQQMRPHEAVQKNFDDRLNKNRRKEVSIVNRYEKQRPEFLKTPEELEDMWDGHLRQIKISRHQIKLASDDIRPRHSANYRTEATAR